MGTGYKSAYILGQNETNLNISTVAHPGFYVIKLLQNRSLLTTRYIHAGTEILTIPDLLSFLWSIIHEIVIESVHDRFTIFVVHVIFSVCRKQVNLNLNQNYKIESPEFPLAYHAGIRCSWNVTKVSNNTWFKIYTEGRGFGCLMSFKSDFKDKLCSQTEKNNTLVVPSDSLDIRFSSIKSGPPSYIYVEGTCILHIVTMMLDNIKRDAIICT